MIEKRGGWKWDGIADVLETCGINVGIFLDDRTSTLIEMYLYNRRNPAAAFHLPYLQVPHIWIDATMLLDGILGFRA